MKLRHTFLPALLAIMFATTSLSISGDNAQPRIESAPGISKEEVRALVERVWAKEYESASVTLADVDGDGQEETILAVSIVWRGEGIVAIFHQEKDQYDLWGKISCYGSPGVNAMDLFGDGRQHLIIGSLDGGAKWGQSMVHIYRWDEGGFTEIWQGVTSENGFSMRDQYSVDAKLQFVDLNRDRIMEIVRIGTVCKGEWETLPGLQKAQLPKTETKLFPKGLNMPGPYIDFSVIKAGYKALCRFRETFFYDEEFMYYIQYKARLDQKTASIAAGTKVGVLGTVSETNRSALYPDSYIHIVLPGPKVVRLPDAAALERIRTE